MKTWAKVLIISLLSFCTAVISVGYAALTDSLYVSGSVKVTLPDTVFITRVELVEGSMSGVDYYSASELGYSTSLDSVISRSEGTSDGTVAFNVTVFNNTDRTYAFKGLSYQSDLSGYNNGLITEEDGTNASSSIKIITSLNDDGSSKLAAHGSLTFQIRYTVGSALDADTQWKNLINIQFGINVDSLVEAESAVINKLENLLNSPETYNEIINNIDNKYSLGAAEWKATYIGNVAGSTSDDSLVMSQLFGDTLNMMIGGTNESVTVILKRENIDGSDSTGDSYTLASGSTYNGCEYTLYMTVDDLFNTSGSATVIAAVFTCDVGDNGELGDWYMIGDYYSGTAEVVGYEGGYTGGSFDTGSWRSSGTQTFDVTENYSYTIYSNQTIGSLITATDTNAVSELRELMLEAQSIINGSDQYAGTGWIALENTYSSVIESGTVTIADDGTVSVNSSIARSRLVSYIKAMDDELRSFAVSELQALLNAANEILGVEGGSETDRLALQAACDAVSSTYSVTLSESGEALIDFIDDDTRATLTEHIDAMNEALGVFDSL